MISGVYEVRNTLEGGREKKGEKKGEKDSNRDKLIKNKSKTLLIFLAIFY